MFLTDKFEKEFGIISKKFLFLEIQANEEVFWVNIKRESLIVCLRFIFLENIFFLF